MKGVIWTDVVQFLILVGGVLSVIIFIVCRLPNGFADIWQVTKETHHGFNIGMNSGFWDFNLTQRISIWTILIGVLPGFISPVTDQVNLQLCLANKNYRSLAMSMLGQTVGGLPFIFIFYIAGLAVLTYVRTLGSGTALEEISQGDKAYTYFISHIMPIGLRGLIIAGLLSAAISTVVSVVNSLATVTVKDIYQRIFSTKREESHYLKIAKMAIGVWGIVAVAAGWMNAWICYVCNISLLEFSNTCLYIFSGIIIGLFALGLLNPRANNFGAWFGFIGGSCFSLFITYYFYLRCPLSERISFIWLGILTPISVFVIGSLASYCRPCPERKSELVIWKNPLLNSRYESENK